MRSQTVMFTLDFEFKHLLLTSKRKNVLTNFTWPFYKLSSDKAVKIFY